MVVVYAIDDRLLTLEFSFYDISCVGGHGPHTWLTSFVTLSLLTLTGSFSCFSLAPTSATVTTVVSRTVAAVKRDAHSLAREVRQF